MTHHRRIRVLPAGLGASRRGLLFSQANNAVLKFRSAGVTHVITVPTGGALPFAFMPSAESQGYRPRYAMNSLEIPAFVDLNVPNAQLKDALAVGWLPTSDVLTPQRPNDNPAERLCFRDHQQPIRHPVSLLRRTVLPEGGMGRIR